MSIQIIEIRQFQGPATVELSGVGVPEIVEVRQGPAGLNGPNSVTSATTSDGTAELLVSNIISGQGVGSQARITGVNQNENSIIGGYFESYVAEAVVGISRDSVGVVGTSENDVGVRASSQQGDYSAQFENDFTPQSAIERVRGWFVWFYNTFTGRLKTADITANRDWTLPDRTGNIALTEDYTAGTATIDVLNATVQGTLTANHIHGNIAGSVYAHVRAGENLAKGDPVYVSGFHAGSGYAEVSKADASNASKMPAVGVMDAAVSANANGHMVITGTISDIDTNAYAINSVLYVASGGGFTTTPPAANSQPVAIVERSNTNNGAVIVKVNGLASSGGNGASDANKLARFSSSGTLPIANIGGLGTGVAIALAVNTGTAGAFVVNGGALGTPSSGTLTSCTGLPISTGVSGLGANVATFLATPTSANLAAAVTGETGTGALVFGTSPTITTPTVRGAGTTTGTALLVQNSTPTARFIVRDDGQVGINGYIPSTHLPTSGYAGIWMDTSNCGMLAEVASGFRAVNISANATRSAAGLWAQQDTSRNSFILSLGYEASNNGLTLYRAPAGSGNSLSVFFTVNDTGQLTISGNQIRVATSQTPASATATGTAGTICWDANYIYVCTATNTWKRTAISTW